MRLKVHRKQGDVLVAICDADLIGKEITTGGSSFEVTEGFYGDESVTPEEAEEILVQATIVNVLGENAVACAVAAGVVREGNVGELGDVPHAQMIEILR